jgi:ArsR family transcriptional regulator
MRLAQSPVAKVFRALGDDTRLQILAVLGVREACVCELVDLFGMSQPAISEHLRRLKDVGLVEADRRGTWVFYSRVADPPAFVRAALETVEVPGELLARFAGTSAGRVCARAETSPQPPAAVVR